MKRFAALTALCLAFVVLRTDAPKLPKVHADEPRSKWTKVETPLKVDRYDTFVAVDGFWQSTSSQDGKQLAFPIVVSIECERGEKMCKEAAASVQLGTLTSELSEYESASWTKAGVVADATGTGGACGIGHRLSIDFQSNSVTVTDYPKKTSNIELCKPYQDANSYSLHGGKLVLYPPAKWEPLAKPEEKK